MFLLWSYLFLLFYLFLCFLDLLLFCRCSLTGSNRSKVDPPLFRESKLRIIQQDFIRAGRRRL